MKLKKTNAILGLLSTLCLLLHVCYSAFAYLTFYYNPLLKYVFSLPFIVLTCLHAVCGMLSVFLLSDGTRLTQYPRQNRQTLLQRVSAAAIFPLLILHLDTFSLMQSCAEKGQTLLILLLMLVQVLFYAVVLLHIAVSVTKGFITLGLLSSDVTRKRMDTVIYVLSAILLAAASFSVIKGEAAMFIH